MRNVKFKLTTISIAAVLALGVWFGLSELKKKAPDVYAKIARTSADYAKTAGEAVERLPAPEIPIVEAWRAAAVESIGKTAKELGSAAAAAEAGRTTAADPPETPETNGDAGDDAVEEAEEPAAVAEAEPDEPLNVDPLAALNGDPGYPWGIVVTNSYFYDARMQPLGVLPGGTVVSCKGKRLIPNGYIFECHYLANRAWRNDTVILYEADLVVFDTTYADANKEQRNLLVEYCRLYGMLEQLRGEAQKKLLETNPHIEEYRAAATAYMEFNDRVAAKMEEYKKTEGPRRLELGEELRKLRYSQVPLKNRYDTASAEYEKWKELNVNPRIGALRTTEMTEIEKMMDRLRPEVQKIVPGL